MIQRSSTSTPDSNTFTPIIRASEIGQYIFCRRAWWLGDVQGYRPVDDAALSAGVQAHLQHGRTVAVAQRWQWAGYVLLVAGALLGALLMCGLLGGRL